MLVQEGVEMRLVVDEGGQSNIFNSLNISPQLIR